MKNKYLKYFPYQEKGFCVAGNNSNHLLFCRNMEYVYQHILITTLSATSSVFGINVEINCTYQFHYRYSMDIRAENRDINEVIKIANDFIEEKLALVDENFHLHHITKYSDGIIFNQHKKLYQEMKDKYHFKEPQDILKEIHTIYDDYKDIYIDFIKYASSCYVEFLLKEGFEMVEEGGAKALLARIPKCEYIYPSQEIDKIWRKEKTIEELKIDNFNRIPRRYPKRFSSALINKKDTHLEYILDKYQLKIVDEKDNWVLINVPTKIGNMNSINKVCKNCERVSIGVLCFSEFSIIKIYDKKQILITIENKKGVLKIWNLSDKMKNLEEINKYIVEPYTYNQLLEALNMKTEFTEDIVYEVLKMLGVNEKLFESFDWIYERLKEVKK